MKFLRLLSILLSALSILLLFIIDVLSFNTIFYFTTISYIHLSLQYIIYIYIHNKKIMYIIIYYLSDCDRKILLKIYRYKHIN